MRWHSRVRPLPRARARGLPCKHAGSEVHCMCTCSPLTPTYGLCHHASISRLARHSHSLSLEGLHECMSHTTTLPTRERVHIMPCGM